MTLKILQLVLIRLAKSSFDPQPWERHERAFAWPDRGREEHERAEIRAQPANRDFRLRLTCSSGTRHTSSLRPPLVRLHRWALLQCGGWQEFCRNLPGGFHAPNVLSGEKCFPASAGRNGLHSTRHGFRPVRDWFGEYCDR